MLIDTNIDLHSGGFNTNAPFTQDSLMSIGDTRLSFEDFISVVVYCGSSVVPPVYIGELDSVDSAKHVVDVWFLDSLGARVGALRLSLASNTTDGYVTAFICSSAGAIKGHAMLSSRVIGAFVDAAENTGGSALHLPPNAFVLGPQSCIAYLEAAGRSVTIADTVCLSNTTVSFTDFVRAEPVTYNDLVANGRPAISTVSPYACISVVGEYITSDDADGCVMLNVVNSAGDSTCINVRGRHLAIRSNVTSNIRVVADGFSITIQGVVNG